MREVVTRTGVITLDEARGIIRIRNKAGVLQTLSDAQENIAKLLELSAGKIYPVLVELAGSNLPREVRAYYGGPEVQAKLRAIALVGMSPVERVLGNFFLALLSSKRPARLFATEREALEWLAGFTPVPATES